MLQVDLVSASNESFYGDCPIQTTYTNLDLNGIGHTTCTVVPQGTYHLKSNSTRYKCVMGLNELLLQVLRML